MWPLHPGGNQKIYSWGPQKRPQDRRTTLLKSPFWHAKHAQNARAKRVPDSIGVGVGVQSWRVSTHGLCPPSLPSPALGGRSYKPSEAREKATTE